MLLLVLADQAAEDPCDTYLLRSEINDRGPGNLGRTRRTQVQGLVRLALVAWYTRPGRRAAAVARRLASGRSPRGLS